ncbi:MAG TPA: hypothetical protein VJX72_05390 [Candidatus Acidoferrum sp.]|nr:hypothetical protein [Candidatus Acidoferrum sp.]
MKLHSPRSTILLALLTFLIAILACTALLNAQTGPAAQSASDTPTSAPDPEFLARAIATIVHSRKLIDSFFEQTSNVVCTENVSQTVVGKNNKPMYREESAFEYQMQSSSRSGSLRLTESRESRKAAFRDPNKTLLITNGFASMLLVLHENYESSYVFEPASEETVDGRTVLKIHFKPIPGASSPAAIQLHGRNYPLQLKGDIWIDEESAAVVKLISSLDASLEDLGLRELRSEIHYSIVQFHAPEEAYWMPASAVIDVETPKQHWRNVHRFTDYRRFRATIQVDLGEKQP